MRADIELLMARGVAAVARLGRSNRVAVMRKPVERFGARAISIAVLAAALIGLKGVDFRSVIDLLPHRPLFWVVLTVTYFVPVMADWIIYHRIWRLPSSGIVPLTRKLIGNELIVGYLGDAYLFAWARQRRLAPSNAIAQIKDVAILSAAASSGATILFAAMAAPFAGLLSFHIPFWSVVAGSAVVAAPPVVALTLGNALFVLPRKDLAIALGTHALRAIATPILLAVLWHLALPTLALQWWILLAAARLVLSRLPFVSNKDLILAGVAAMLFGHHTDITTVLTMVAAVMTLCHLTAGIVLSLGDVALASLKRKRRQPVLT